ncbi:hypothetical protein [Nioella nitratireducens]|uniref:hypothetical protein n=1 Tax=Nioella nitratireducens TaxID=1287720 RepID=UPI0011BA5581|nr:hypothetical protein [Nioella nitratireducens]
MIKAILPALAALAFAVPALADEVWSSDTGQIVYLADEYGSAILTFTDTDGTNGELVFPGLAGNFTDRSVHYGYWVGQSALQCPAALGRPGALTSLSWGMATIAFDDPGFPSAFTVLLADCDGDFDRSIRATPF